MKTGNWSIMIDLGCEHNVQDVLVEGTIFSSFEGGRGNWMQSIKRPDSCALKFHNKEGKKDFQCCQFIVDSSIYNGTQTDENH